MAPTGEFGTFDAVQQVTIASVIGAFGATKQ